MRNGSTLLGSTAVKPSLGAGGFITGGTIANDGTLLVRTDTYNAFSRGPSATEWTPELRPGVNCAAADINLFYGDPYPWGSVGTYDVAIAPSNSAVRYLVCAGRVWRTTDAAANYTRLALAEQAGCQPNESSRKGGKPLAVDTQNPAHVWFGAPQSGVRYSIDSGANWTLIPTSTIPLPTAGQRYIIACDPSSAVSSGRKQGWYVFVQGSGLYRTTNGGTSWSLVTAAPSNPTLASHIKIDSAGRLFLTGIGSESVSKVRIFNGTSWTEHADKTCKSICFNPHNGYVYSIAEGGNLDFSTDNGVTWQFANNNGSIPQRVATDIPWQAWTDEGYMANGEILADPVTNRLWVLEGIGAWRTGTPITTAAATHQLFEASKGIENMVTSNMTVAPDGTVGYACHDRGAFILPRSDAGKLFPSRHGIDFGFQHAQATDYAPEDNAFWVASAFLGNRGHGYTTDRGQTWTATNSFTTTSGAGGGGQLAVLSKDIWLTLNAQASKPLASNVAANRLYITIDRGATWQPLTIGDNTAVFGQGSYGQARRVLVKDRFTPGRFYFFNMGDSDNAGSAGDLACRGTWRGDVNLTTGAVTSLTRISVEKPLSSHALFGFGVKLQQVGPNDWIFVLGDDRSGLFRSTDGMLTWQEMTGTDDQGGTKWGECFALGIGKAAKGSAHQTFYAAGWRNAGTTGTSPTGFGYWLSEDNGATWKRDAQFLNSSFDLVQDIVGDPLEYGRFLVGYGGSGIYQRRYDYKLRAS